MPFPGIRPGVSTQAHTSADHHLLRGIGRLLGEDRLPVPADSQAVTGMGVDNEKTQGGNIP